MYTILGYLWQYITNPKAIIALSLFISLISSYSVLPRRIFWLLLGLYLLGLIGYGIYWLIDRRRNIAKGEDLSNIIQNETEKEYSKSKDKEELAQIQQQVKESIQLIRKSKLGDKSGNAALYELPWYMVIGNPAAGKSSAIYNSGLNFPFEEKHQQAISSGQSGTKNCDWFFSTDGILLDTAGRYSIYAEDKEEWLDFLSLLKKNRSKAPINGLLVVVSVAELVSQSPEKSLQLAKNLRARIQDITERLEVIVPIYVVFTKMDLIAGFTEFFECYEGKEFDQVWGATLAYDAESSQNAMQLFDEHYTILHDGLKNLSTTHLSRRHADNISPSVMTFPLEFKMIKPALKSFIGALFEDNPYQFKPVFRGFYFTSALQDGHVESPMTDKISEDFQLQRVALGESINRNKAGLQTHGYFLKNLFSEVVLKDKNLVKQHINSNRKRQRHILFIVGLLAVSTVLGLWVWSYKNNQQLIADVQADFNKVEKIEKVSSRDLPTQLDALLILQNRLQQLDDLNQQSSYKFSFGLYQGEKLYEKVKIEYLKGIQKIILQPTNERVEDYLKRVKGKEDTLLAKHPEALQVTQANNQAKQSLDPSETDPQDIYNALKLYIMMGNPQYIDPTHLSDQITRFWRSWLEENKGNAPKAETTQKAEQVLSYLITLSTDKHFPVLQSNPHLIDQTRQLLISVVQATPAINRVYSQIKTRAAVRFPPLTIAQIVGNDNKKTIFGGYELSGAFTQKAWEEYVSKAIDEAANKPTDTKDWVLNSVRADDLTLSGSPDQIQKQLVQLYKQDYVNEWRKFLGEVHYAKTDDFTTAVQFIDVLGEQKRSPIRILMEKIAQETSWDNPVIQAELAAPQTGFVAWFKRTVLNQTSSNVVAHEVAQQPQGYISQEFTFFYEFVRKRDDQQNKSLLDDYLNNLAQVRSKFNNLKNTGDIGPNALMTVSQTLNDQNSIFNSVQKNMDEKLTVGLNSQNQQIVHKIIVSPFIQCFESLLTPAQNEVNKLWDLQIVQPFNQNLAKKYPFNGTANIQATSAEIGQIFGENGSIARFVKETLDPLIVRRGYVISSKTWKDLGINLNPQFIANFQSYVAPANGVATGGINQAPVAANQSNFQFYPLQNPKLLSYTLDIDGQRMFYENGIQQWVSFVWPNPGSTPGVRITVVDLEGKVHTIFDAPGEYGINRLIDSAQRNQHDGVMEMTWANPKNSELYVKLNFRLISGNTTSNVGSGRGYAGLKLVDQVTANKVARVVSAQSVVGAK